MRAVENSDKGRTHKQKKGTDQRDIAARNPQVAWLPTQGSKKERRIVKDQAKRNK